MKRISHPAHLSAFFLAGAILVLSGCHRHDAEPYRVFSPPPTARTVNDKSKEPADLYVSLGQEALTALPEPQAATYTPGYMDQIRRKAAPIIAKLTAASAKPVVIPPRIRPMDEPLSVEAGWVRLGRAVSWTIDADIRDGNYPGAVQLAITAHRFGFDLTHGDIAQAQAGLTIADMARDSIWSHVSEFSPTDIKNLADGITAALPRLAPTQETLTDEKPNQLAVLQAIQTAYQDRNSPLPLASIPQSVQASADKTKPLHVTQLDLMSLKAYNDTREAWSYLQRMSEDERSKYFDQFAAEVDESSALAQTESKETQSQRDPEIAKWLKDKSAIKYRPWKRLMPQYFLTWQPYLDQYDLTLARTRMTVLNTLVAQALKATGTTPDLMAIAPDAVKIDPYSGKPFSYAHASTDYKIYSVGPDGRDDGGTSDKRGTDPDVVLPN